MTEQATTTTETNATGEAAATGKVNMFETRTETPAGDQGTSWFDGLPDDLKGDKSLDVYSKDPEGLSKLIKSHNEAQKMLGQKGLVRPGEGATDEEKAAFDKQLRQLMNVPESADKYDMTVPEKYKDVPRDEAMGKEFSELGLKIGLSPEQMAAINEWSYEFISKQAEAGAQQADMNDADFEKSMKEAYGDKATETMEKAKATMLSLVSEQNRAALAELPNAALVGLVEAFNTVNTKFMGEDVPELAALRESGKTPDQVRQDKLQLMQSKAYSDPMHPEHEATVKKVNELNTLYVKATSAKK